MRINILKTIPGYLLQKLCNRKHCTGIKPTRYMIATNMIKKRLFRDSKYNILQLFQIANTSNFLHCIRITKDKIAKTEVIRHRPSQINIHFLRILINKARIKTSSINLILRFRRLDYKRNKLIFLPNLRTKFYTCQSIFFSFSRKTNICYYPQYIISILFIKLHRFLICACQCYFRTPTHT